VLGELEETFGMPVVEAYAMTEAAHQMTRKLRQAWGDLAILGGRVPDRHTLQRAPELLTRHPVRESL